MTDDELKALADLLPCPFCGAKADMLLQAFTRASDDFAFWSVECQGCGVEVADSDSQDAANRHWNTRANLPAIIEQRAEIERLRAKVEGITAAITDSSTVAINMLRGSIAKPSIAHIRHIYGDALNPTGEA